MRKVRVTEGNHQIYKKIIMCELGDILEVGRNNGREYFVTKVDRLEQARRIARRIMNEFPSQRGEIGYVRRNNTVVCTIVTGGRIHVGASYCAPGDQFDMHIGAAIALSRASDRCNYKDFKELMKLV